MPTSNHAHRYRQLAHRFTAVVDAVPAEAWSNPSPCRDWTALQVLTHVIDSEQHLAERLGFTTLPGSEGVEADPRGIWAANRDAMQALMDDEATADTEFEGTFGTTTFGDAITQFFSFDLIVHAWDIATATGVAYEIDPGSLAWVEEKVAQWEQAGVLRADGVIGPPVEPAPGASPEEVVMAYLGRRVD